MALKSGLRMALPWRDPRSGIFYLRARVPSDIAHLVRGTTARLPVGDALVPVVLGDAAKVSLRTRDPAVAKSSFIAASAALAAHYEALRKGPVHLSKRQIVALAGLIYSEQVEAFGDDPGDAAVWRQLRRLHAQAEAEEKLEEWLGVTVDEVLARQHLAIDAESRAALLLEANSALT